MDLQAHIAQAYQDIEAVRREIEVLLTSPDLNVPALQSNHLSSYKRWYEKVQLRESYSLNFVQRFIQADRNLTKLCQRLIQQVKWPLETPLIASFSHEYYWTVVQFHLICVPAAEDTTLLGWPDLCHELGHSLFANFWQQLIGNFVPELSQYIQAEQNRSLAHGTPGHYAGLILHLQDSWLSGWITEFVCDMVATYLVGSAYGLQHVRLFSREGTSGYHPSLGEEAAHPADEARLQGVLAVLREMKHDSAAVEVEALWNQYMALTNEIRPPNYAVCYPQYLLASLAANVVEGCRNLNIRAFDAITNTDGDISALIQEAWTRFQDNPLHDPLQFADWEQQQLQQLWIDLNTVLS